MKALLAAILAPALLFASPAAAQGPQPAEGWRITAGAGALFTPAYEGDDDYRLRLLPNIKIEYGDRFFASVQDGLGYRVINEESLRVGPIARIAFARNEDGSEPFAITGERTTDLIGLGNVATTAELGAFAEVDFGPLTAGLEARYGVNGHNGFVADASLRYSGVAQFGGPPLIYSFGPRMTIVGDDYNDAYFSVTPVQSFASGLPVFDADGGVQTVGAGATAILPLTRRTSLVAVAGYDRFVGDAGDAPLIRLRGSRNQATVGVFFGYTF
ncbi:MAG: MipA/OmpV family protein [Pseudomonadota bacterium]